MRLGSGKYVAIGTAGVAAGAKKLLTSADGVTWQIGTGLGTWLDSLAVVGPRIVAISVVPNTALPALWESTDGSAWQRIALLDGNPLSGTQVVSLGDRVGLFSGSKLTMVGAPLPAGYATNSPQPTSSTSTAASPTASPALALVAAVALASAEPRAGHQRYGRPRSERLLRPLRHVNVHLAERLVLAGPADPAIFATDGAALFAVVGGHRPDGGFVVNAGEGVWYSLDGVHWKPATVPRPPRFPGRPIWPERFHADRLARRRDRGKSRLYGSPDGVTWTAVASDRWWESWLRATLQAAPRSDRRHR